MSKISYIFVEEIFPNEDQYGCELFTIGRKVKGKIVYEHLDFPFHTSQYGVSRKSFAEELVESLNEEGYLTTKNPQVEYNVCKKKDRIMHKDHMYDHLLPWELEEMFEKWEYLADQQ